MHCLVIHSCREQRLPANLHTNKNQTVFTMLNNLTHSATKLAHSLTPLQWWCIAVVLVVIRQLTQVWLDGLYLDSQFPKAFPTAQSKKQNPNI
jgi:hypothetical protein